MVDELTRMATERAERHKARIRELYALAKSLGFSAAEAAVLCNRSEASIRALAAQRAQAAREPAE